MVYAVIPQKNLQASLILSSALSKVKRYPASVPLCLQAGGGDAKLAEGEPLVIAGNPPVVIDLEAQSAQPGGKPVHQVLVLKAPAGENDAVNPARLRGHGRHVRSHLDQRVHKARRQNAGIRAGFLLLRQCTDRLAPVKAQQAVGLLDDRRIESCSAP